MASARPVGMMSRKGKKSLMQMPSIVDAAPIYDETIAISKCTRDLVRQHDVGKDRQSATRATRRRVIAGAKIEGEKKRSA